jgi:hypothetical protein
MARRERQDILRTFDQLDIHYDWLYQHLGFLGNTFIEFHPDISARLKIVLDTIKCTQDYVQDLRSKI